jgi:hypothetical protein
VVTRGILRLSHGCSAGSHHRSKHRHSSAVSCRRGERRFDLGTIHSLPTVPKFEALPASRLPASLPRRSRAKTSRVEPQGFPTPVGAQSDIANSEAQPYSAGSMPSATAIATSCCGSVMPS